MISILIVCAEPPYPANHGGRMDVMQQIVAFSKLGYRLDILFVGNNIDDFKSEKKLKEYAIEVYKVNRKKGFFSFLLSILKLNPYQIISRRELKSVIINKSYDVILLESEYVMKVLDNSTIKTTKKILRVHNNEYRYFKALAKSSKKLSRFYYFIESILFLFFKNKAYKSVDELLFISRDECLAKYHNAKWLPPNMPVSYPFNGDKYDKVSRELLFIGNLFMPNNLEGIIWFLNRVYQNLILSYPSIKLTIAGSCKNKVDKKLIESINKFEVKCIKLIVNPSDEELIDLYCQNVIFINPMLNGAGVKLKTIDAMRNSMAVVSTSVGVEGTGLIEDIHYKLANTEDEFFKQIVFLIENVKETKKIAYSSYEFVANNFNIENQISRHFNTRK